MENKKVKFFRFLLAFILSFAIMTYYPSSNTINGTDYMHIVLCSLLLVIGFMLIDMYIPNVIIPDADEF